MVISIFYIIACLYTIAYFGDILYYGYAYLHCTFSICAIVLIKLLVLG